MTGRFTIEPTPIQDLTLLTRRRMEDERGFLERMFCARDLAEIGIEVGPVQVNRTLTRRKGAVRGLHFQHPPHAEIKIVSCLRGRVQDVAVDLRRGSPTFLTWFSAELSEENGKSLAIPRGFAHGFQTLTEDCELLYFHSDYYEPAAEAGFNAGDETIAVAWPLPVSEMSGRDRSLPRVDKEFEGLAL